MIRDQFLLDIAPELIVDNFAGGGGASCGIELALGRHVDVAINHDPEAVAMHAMNHPQTDHHCESVWDVNPLAVTRGRPVGLAWFSPDCKHFSKAKGGKPRDKRIRGLAWVALRWAALARPRVIILENVEEFQTWGPLLADGNPCPRRRGDTFRSFVRQLQEKGYAVEWRELRACDFGAPTIRKRLFLIARCDGQPVVWPEPTHGAPDSAAVKAKRLKPWRTAAECIDWSIPCPSIFERQRPLAEATQRRIARGLHRYVINAAAPFIVKVNHGRDEFRGQPISEPMQTLTAKHGFGLVAPHLTKFRTGSTGAELRDPMPTITAGPKENPAGAPHALGLIMPVLTECANASTQRTFRADEPLRTQCAEVKGGHFALAAATLVQTGYGERPGQAPRAPGLDKPLGTVVAGGAKHALVSAFLAKHYGGNYEGPGVGLAEPASTITTADHHALVSSHMLKMYGTTTGSDADAPMPTVTSGGNHIGEVRAFLIKYYSEGGQDQRCRDPMHTIPTRDRLGLVTVAGEQYQIADIGMRMLEPHELYAAQGFPSSYVIAPVINGRRLPKHAQVRMCGNSVSPPMAAALVRANLPDLASWSPTEVKLMREAA
ncbi:DNA cytosine methyltransferase [Ralstonia solanacearum]|uniref:DNA cytosine methyltransferase n=1 Tax=Ralstonia pseudosolanacearum TaxID=1310165 RepID=UPI00090392CB|nr:DNA cytosine methyltransferase [Ralstonia pseudosolanacearum]APF86894.1 type II restriction endonuclease subunit M [Ralstonia solanacearum FJAT-1458]QKL71426.1 DNA cytosine methyltransferase [Ralstonia solanacearum]MDO3524103.1 DNA cytosine methyltransferase [Ralstonia pseudosolanacearum]MDO3552438.1 DNA cytosine methyltransferase [Ralstonia pseudosolanacearum]MDO3591259.1 DNA cytosine methyltransferase [Ralstonia pseudosolanacearum]